jgi:hypothetical protein
MFSILFVIVWVALVLAIESRLRKRKVYPPNATPFTDVLIAKREVEAAPTRLQGIQIPTRYLAGLVDSRCYYCKSGIAGGQPTWVLDDESGEERHMCGRCRDSLIVDKRRRVS